MLRWCAFCQQFQGEVAPFDDLKTTHGMCPTCAAKGLEHTDLEFEHARKLQHLQEMLMTIGESGNLNAADEAISESVKMGVLPVDLLMGLISPLLYQVGENWKNGVMSVAEEHRFTSFCLEVLEKVEWGAAREDGESIKAFIVNARGNRHTLAVRILALWLRGKGVSAQVLCPSPSLQDLAERVLGSKAQALLISVALAEQRAAAVEIVEFFTKIPAPNRPRLVVGGYAVKCGLVSAIPGAELISDISELKLN